MGISDEEFEHYKFYLDKHPEMGDNTEMLGFKPSWNRMSLHFVFRDYELDYLMFAINFVANYGDKLLTVYNFNPVGGEWHHKSGFEHKIPGFNFDELVSDERRYVADEKERIAIFEKQKQDALKLVETLPESKGLNKIEDHCYFYVENGNLLHGDEMEKKQKLKQQANIGNQ